MLSPDQNTLEHKHMITFWKCGFVPGTQNSLYEDQYFFKQNHSVRFFVCWCWMKCSIGRILFQLHSQWELQSPGFSASHLSVNLQQYALLKCERIFSWQNTYNIILFLIRYTMNWDDHSTKMLSLNQISAFGNIECLIVSRSFFFFF